jgi:hypothetical protein
VRPYNDPTYRNGFSLGLHGFKTGFAWFQTPNQPGTRPKAAGQPKAGLAKPDAAKPHKK